MKRSVPKKGNPEFSVDSKAFEAAGWNLNKSDLKLGEVIGKGEFGGNRCYYHPFFFYYRYKISLVWLSDVVLGFFRGQKVAVKTLKDTTKPAHSFLAEASLMS